MNFQKIHFIGVLRNNIKVKYKEIARHRRLYPRKKRSRTLDHLYNSVREDERTLDRLYGIEYDKVLE